MTHISRVRLHWLIGAALTALFAACESSTAPKTITGTWVVTQTWSGDSLDCSFTGETLVVAQVDTLLDGQLRGGRGKCVIDGYPLGPLTLIADSLRNGRVRGSLVSFGFGPALQYQGFLMGTQIAGTSSGSVVWYYPVSDTIQTVGRWTAVQQ